MKEQQGKLALLSSLLLLWYIAFFTGLIFHFRVVSSISTGLLLITGLVYHKTETGLFFNKGLFGFTSLSCLLYFVCAAVIFLLKDDAATAMRQIELKSSLLLVPLAVCSCNFLTAEKGRQLMLYYILLLSVACLYCITAAFIHYSKTANSAQFFYHSLVSPIKQHAVYFSLLVLFVQFYLLETAKKKKWLFRSAIHLSFIVFFTVFIILLSSKLVTGIYLFYLLYFFLFGKQRLIGEKKTSIVTGTALLAGLAIVFITSNPVSNRFRDIFSGSVSVIQKKKYNPSDYFNGLQFRLLQWKLVPEILSENENWMTGTGDANAQKVLVAKYISKNMYQGMPGTGDTGYLSYNTHNQFLQSLLTTGLTGAFFFLLLIASLLYTVWHNNTLFRAALLTVLLFSLTEACFETQYGILIFIFFPLFFLKIEKKNYQLNKL